MFTKYFEDSKPSIDAYYCFMHTKDLAGQMNVFPRDERMKQHRKLWFSTVRLANRLFRIACVGITLIRA